MSKYFIIIGCLIISFCVFAQEDIDFKYERSSLYMMMIKHPNLSFNREIEFVFSRMEKPDRFNDHGLGVHSVQFAEDKDQIKNINSFIKQVQLGKKIVAKWFNRNKLDGSFNMELIKERGNYNATMFDVNVAKQQIRGGSLLEDAGEILVSNTYLVMNDIYYVDKSNKWQIVKDGLNVATSLAEPWLLGTTSTITDNDNPFESSYAWLYGEYWIMLKVFVLELLRIYFD